MTAILIDVIQIASTSRSGIVLSQFRDLKYITFFL